MTVRDQLSEAQLVALARAFAGQEPWSFELYRPLCAFGYALSRLDLPDLPAVLSFGDVMQALDDLQRATNDPWQTHTAVATSTFEELGYESTSAGITRVRDSNTAAWREHGLNNKEFLLRAAELAGGTRAVVIGAGKIYDIPLRKLAARFEQLVLVDIDAGALAASVKQAGLEPALLERLSLLQADVTGINDSFMEKARAALALAGEDNVHTALLELLHSYRLEEPPDIFIDGAARAPDFACSSMVLSQLATPLTRYVQQRFAARFPQSQRAQADEFQIALGQFAHRVQQDHVRALLKVAPRVALSSDVTDRYTALDEHGNMMQAVARLPLLGAPVLEALVPRLRARSVLRAEWEWRHVIPTRSKPRGRTVQVNGVLFERV